MNLNVWYGARTVGSVLAVLLFSGVVMSFTLIAAIVTCTHADAPATLTCHTFHRAVVIVPAVCAKHDICETAIEAKVCDSILIRGAKR